MTYLLQVHAKLSLGNTVHLGTTQRLINCADKKLYQAKDSGKDQVVF